MPIPQLSRCMRIDGAAAHTVLKIVSDFEISPAIAR